MYQYPSTTVNWKVVPTGANATPYIGDANKLLYQTKNMMKFNSLDQLRSIRVIFGDTGIAAKIIAISSFGQDFIEIQVPSGVITPIPVCSITLFNVPATIQPMHWYSDGIHDSKWLITNPGGTLEVENVDYIKTYYYFASENCSDCTLDLTVCDTNELAITYGWGAPQTCTPFVFVDAAIPIKEGYPNNHCINGTCQAEVISMGSDAGGTYFIWKAYTEWSQLGPQYAWTGGEGRTGLGYLLLQGFSRHDGDILCTSDINIVKVDCCGKAIGLRTPIIYWEKCVGGGWCVAPSSGTIKTDLDYFWNLGAWVLMTLWSKENWCRPMTWTASGFGDITPSEDGTYGYYKASYTELGLIDCHTPIVVTGTDRCGTSDSITFTSCCDSSPATLEIGYTTLAMSCSGVQTLTAGGGCSPYTWALTAGGGTLVDNEDGTATYTAPATNAECANNATITLTDCCGSSDHIHIAVNCYAPATDAMRMCTLKVCDHDCVETTPGHCYVNGIIGAWWYLCNGTQSAEGFEDLVKGSQPTYDCANASDGGCSGASCQNLTPCNCNYKSYYCYYSNICPGNPGCDGIKDLRTAAMKTAGCCPINPLTGLPF